jgi:hypothetical protein
MLLVYEELNVGNNFLWIFLHFVFEQNLLVAFCMFNLCFNKHFCLFFQCFQSCSQLRLSRKNIKVIIDIRSKFHIIPLKSYKVPTFLPLVYISYYSWMFYTCCNWIFCHTTMLWVLIQFPFKIVIIVTIATMVTVHCAHCDLLSR